MSTYHLYAIGNALVDSEFEVSDAQLRELGVDKRHMSLIDGPRRAGLLQALAPQQPRRTGGGSAGNTVVAFAQLGGRAFYSCRVGDDCLGDFYQQDLRSNRVDSNLHGGPGAPSAAAGAIAGAETGSCLVLVTPDAERSMCTYLGTSAELDGSALVPDALAAASTYYMEGYLAASPTGLEAALQGRALARQHGLALAATLSDVSMIRFCRAGLEALIGDGLDCLFCNVEEAQAWTGLSDLEPVLAALSGLANTVCVTVGPQGCWVVQGGQTHRVPGTPVQAVDTNGAGDMFAGAFLYAQSQGHSAQAAAALGNMAAAVVVAQHGNRLSADQMAEIKQRFEAAEKLD